jgi:hypothetical protein
VRDKIEFAKLSGKWKTGIVFTLTLIAFQGCQSKPPGLLLGKSLLLNSDEYRWLQKAAILGTPGAALKIANFHGYLLHEEQSLKWIKFAARQGDAAAQFSLGSHLSEKGKTNEANFWLNKAASKDKVYKEMLE